MGGTTTSKFNVDQLAQVTWEAMHAFDRSLGLSKVAQASWDELPQSIKNSSYTVVRNFAAVLVNNPNASGPEAHECWLTVMKAKGKTTPQTIPFTELDTDARIKCFIYAGIIRAVWDNDTHHFR